MPNNRKKDEFELNQPSDMFIALESHFVSVEYSTTVHTIFFCRLVEAFLYEFLLPFFKSRPYLFSSPLIQTNSCC